MSDTKQFLSDLLDLMQKYNTVLDIDWEDVSDCRMGCCPTQPQACLYFGGTGIEIKQGEYTPDDIRELTDD